ncbi:MAG: DUF2809 domain-containing protein [Verrucomicrobia bacterium]|nr:DUF2809 domain-containing protein [Verrucomicrobiota bacterium]
MRLRTKHLLIALLVFAAEILVGTVFADVRFIRSYLSDFLVVILLYHLIKGFRDDKPLTLAVAVFVFSCLVEATQYFHLSDALGLRRGGLLSVLMGTSFSWIDIIMYFLGCSTSCILDSRILSKTTPCIPLK